MKWVCMSEAGRQVGVSYQTVKEWIEAGSLPAKVFPKGRLRVKVDDLEKFIESLPNARPKQEVLEVLEVSKEVR